MKARKYLLSIGISLVAAFTVFTATSPSIAQDVARIRTEIRQELHKLGLIDSPGGTNAAALGPSSSTDNAIARYDGTTGKLLQNSAVTIDDSGYVRTPNGAAATPAITGADTDSGIYFASNIVGIGVNGNIGMTVKAGEVELATGTTLRGGGSVAVNFRDATLAATNNTTMSENLYGNRVMTNEGASSDVALTAWSAAAGSHITLVVHAPHYLRLTAATGDTIRGDLGGTSGTVTTSATAGYIRSNVVGSTVTLSAVNATTWQIVAITGTWTIDS